MTEFDYMLEQYDMACLADDWIMIDYWMDLINLALAASGE